MINLDASVHASIQLEIPDDLFKLDKLEPELIKALQEATMEASRFWETLAGQRLTASREAYMKGMETTVLGGMAELRLVGDFPVMLETGTGPYSMLKTILRSRNSKMSKKGVKYAVVPIATPGASPFAPPADFRVASEASPPSSWIHPGFEPLNMLDDVIKELEDVIIPKYVDKILEEI